MLRQTLQVQLCTLDEELGDEGVGSSEIQQNCRGNQSNKQPTKHNLLRLLCLGHHHVVYSSCTWLGPHHHGARRGAWWGRWKLSKAWVGALLGIVPWDSTLETDDSGP